jgi:hypothetical protein
MFSSTTESNVMFDQRYVRTSWLTCTCRQRLTL